MKKNLILHAGTGKTGTSAIQLFLQENFKTLEKNGFIYPFSENKKKEARRTQFITGNAGFLNKIAKNRVERKPGDFDVELDALLDAAGDKENIILSNEGIWRFKDRYHHKIAEQCLRRGLVPKVVLYLRPQQQMIVSTYFQKNKLGPTSFEKHFQTAKKVFDYDAMLTRMEMAYGHENIVVKKYDRGAMPNGSAVLDFCKLLGIQVPDSLQTEGAEEINLSPTLPELDVVKYLGQMSLSETPWKFVQAARAGIVDLNEPARIKLSESQTQELRELYNNNESISQRYLSGEELAIVQEEGVQSDAVTLSPTEKVLLRLVMKLNDDQSALRKELDFLRRQMNAQGQ